MKTTALALLALISQTISAAEPPTIKISQIYDQNTMVYIECFKNFPIMFRSFKDSKEIWSKKLLYDCNTSLKAVASASHIFIATKDRVVLAVNLANGDVDWATPLPPGSMSISKLVYSPYSNTLLAYVSKNYFLINASYGTPENHIITATTASTITASRIGYLTFSTANPQIDSRDHSLTSLQSAPVSYTYYPDISFLETEDKVVFMRKGYQTGQIFALKTMNLECSFNQDISYNDPVQFVPVGPNLYIYASYNSALALRADCSTEHINLKRQSYYRSQVFFVGHSKQGEWAFARLSVANSTASKKDLDLVLVDKSTYRVSREVSLLYSGDIAHIGDKFIFDPERESLTFVYSDELSGSSRVITSTP